MSETDNHTNASQNSSAHKTMMPRSKVQKLYVINAMQKIMAAGGEQYIREHPDLTDDQVSLIRLIARCKTGQLGRMVYSCTGCGKEISIGKACHNSQCSNCQSLETAIFTEENMGFRVDAPYFHIVFTVPDDLLEIFKMNKVLCYNLILEASSKTVLDLCEDPQWLGGAPGIMSVLQTFGSKINYRPHVHMVVAAAALNKDHSAILRTPSDIFIRKNGSYRKQFFIPEAVMEPMYRGKFLDGLQKSRRKGELRLPDDLCNQASWDRFIDHLYSMNWIIYCKQTFNGNGDALKYVSRYIGRIAIGNSRIKRLTDTEVTYSYKDYKDGSKIKNRTVTIQQFIGLYIQHVLPHGFKKVRYYGFLAANHRKKCLDAFTRIQGKRIYESRFNRKTKKRDIIRILYDREKGLKCPSCGEPSLELLREEDSKGFTVHTYQAHPLRERLRITFSEQNAKTQKRILRAKAAYRDKGYFHQLSWFSQKSGPDPDGLISEIRWAISSFGEEMLSIDWDLA